MRSPSALPPAAVGLGLRPELAADLLRANDSVDFVEVVAESCFASGQAQREAVALSRVWPVALHGVKLSLGSAEGIDVERARRLGALARAVGAPVVTEHLAFVRAGGREIGHLTPVPFTRAAARVVARNVDVARRSLPDVPLLLENAAWTFRWPDDELDEASFACEVVERTGCGLLLDLGNLYANSVNSGADPAAVLDAYPLDRVAMVHIAGGVAEGGFYFDTHAHPVPDPVFALLAQVVARIGPVPVVLERDDGYPPFRELLDEAERARAVLAGSPKSAARATSARIPRGIAAEPASEEWLGTTQARLALLLTETSAPGAELTRDFGEEAIRRSRDVLLKKRVDEALPLLRGLVKRGAVVREIGRACVEASPRAPTLSGVADAMRIAGAANADPRLAHLAGDARVDLLLLRSRFAGSGDDGTLRHRLAPFVGRELLPGGRTVWVVKGPGADASARVFETRS